MKKVQRKSGKAPGARQTLSEFLLEESGRDPEFAREFERARTETVKRLGRPPGPTTARGQREMRLRAPDDVHKAIIEAAQKSGRTVSNWLLQAARDKLATGQ
jgi:hypothetical protein